MLTSVSSIAHVPTLVSYLCQRGDCCCCVCSERLTASTLATYRSHYILRTRVVHKTVLTAQVCTYRCSLAWKKGRTKRGLNLTRGVRHTRRGGRSIRRERRNTEKRSTTWSRRFSRARSVCNESTAWRPRCAPVGREAEKALHGKLWMRYTVYCTVSCTTNDVRQEWKVEHYYILYHELLV